MFDTKEAKMIYAKGITHFIYRNEALIEDNHSLSITLDMDFFKKVYSLVERRLKIVTKNGVYIKNLKVKANMTRQEFDEAYEFIPQEQHMSVSKYLSEISFGIMCGTQWDLPHELKNVVINNKYAMFILEGEFLKACEANRIFDDNAMEIINKDINNRVYTLLIHDLI